MYGHDLMSPVFYSVMFYLWGFCVCVDLASDHWLVGPKKLHRTFTASHVSQQRCLFIVVLCPSNI